MSRSLILVACVALAGCTGEVDAVHNNALPHVYQAGAIFLGADVISLSSTGKTVDDHIIGGLTDQDCSTLRASHGGPWCQPVPPPVATVSRTEYCYKSLASASCYTQPVAADQTRYTGSRTDQVPAP